MNVFIVATSHNIIQVREAIRYYNLEKKETILLFMHSHNDKPNLSVVPEGVKCFTFRYWTTREIIKSRYDYRVFVSFLNGLKEQFNSFSIYSNFYTSDYVLIAESVLNPSTIVLMDEGTASIGVALKRRKNKSHILKCLMKSVLYLRRISIPRRIVFFSQYSLNINEPDTLIRYSFDKEQNEISVDREYAIVLGQPLSEANVVSEAFYMTQMSLLFNRFNDDGFKRIDYYAHRRESLNKLDRIRALGWAVHENREPFEQVFDKLNPCPSAIYAFYSPILDNLSKKYSCLPDLYIVEIPFKNLICNSAIITEVYKVFKNNPKLKVIML